jgi:hypothetical protein
VVLILVLANYPFLTGSVASAVIIALLLLLVFVLGVVLALVMRSRRHAQYLALEDDQADPGDPADPADPAVQTV